MDLALDNLQRLICHKIQITNQPQNSGTPEPEPNHWLQFNVLARNQRN